MGREIAGVVEKPNGVVVVLNGVSQDKVHVSPKIAEEDINSEELGANECSEENSSAENFQENEPEVLTIKSTNIDASVPVPVPVPAPTPAPTPVPVPKERRTVAQKISDFNKSISPGTIAVSSKIMWVNPKIQQPTVQAAENNGTCPQTVETEPAPATADVTSPNTINLQSTSPKQNSLPNSPQPSHKSSENDLKKHHDEEENWFIASSTVASIRQLKSKVTIGTAPTFRSAERAGKRKEYYNKLEEKHKALEAERIQYEERIREEQEAALKQLRKGLVIKAKPVPSFYYEGPPPKVELKKLPLTRPKSPNLTRRKSCGDATNLSLEEKGQVCTRAQRHSFGSHKSEMAARKSKGQANGHISNNDNKSFKLSSQAKHDKETRKPTLTTINQHKKEGFENKRRKKVSWVLEDTTTLEVVSARFQC